MRASGMKAPIGLLWRAIGLMVMVVWAGVLPANAVENLLETASPSGRHSTESVLTAVARAGNRLVAVGERGIVLLSDDSGASLRQAKVPVSVALTNVRFVSDKKGWAVGHGGVVLTTSDGGETWSKQLDGKQAAQLELDAAKVDGNAGSVEGQNRITEAQRIVAEGPDKPFLDIYFRDETNGLIVGAYGLVFASHDGGKTWQSLKGQIDNPKGKHLYCIYASGSDLYVTGEQGAIYRSSDGGQRFVEVKTPYVGTYFGLIANSAGDLLAYGLRGNVYRSGDHGATWQKVEIGMPVTLTAATRLADGSLVLVDETGRVLKSSDGGQKFVALAVPQPSPFTGIVQAADGNLVVSGLRGLTRLTPKSQPAEAKQ